MTKVNPVPEQSTVRGCPESCFALVQGKILKMKRGNLKKVFINSVLILLGFIFGLGISVFAWVNPSQSPPLGGGVLQTDNSGLKIVTTTQIISGNLTVNTGNVGIGTTNPNNLLQVVDLINFDNTDFNTFLGYQAGKNVVSGAQYNTFIGYQAGFSSSTAASSTADYNTAIGYQALYSNTTGLYNTAIGIFALYSNTEGGVNTAVGPYALYNNTTGDSNTAVGDGALLRNTTGYYNTAVGSNAGSYTGDITTSNATSTYSVYIGANTRASFSGATNEIVIGYGAVGAGSNSVVLGNDSITRTILKGNVGIGTTTPNYELDVVGDVRWSGFVRNNIIVPGGFFGCIGTDYCGDAPLEGLKVGFGGIFLPGTSGTNQLRINFGNLVLVNGNVGIGTTTPSQRLTVVGNIGIQAGANAFIGTLDNYALSLRTNNTDRIFITNAGNVGIGTTAPSTRLAVAGLTSSQAGRTICSDPSGNFYYYVGSCVSSSIKYKTNIQNLGIGLETLLKLRPVTFEFKKDYGGYDGTIHMGFIAEEVEKVSPLLVDYNNGEVSGVRYNEMTALIVKSIQEQQKEIEDLKKEVEELKRIITR
jgi:hypothetical protein